MRCWQRGSLMLHGAAPLKTAQRNLMILVTRVPKQSKALKCAVVPAPRLLFATIRLGQWQLRRFPITIEYHKLLACETTNCFERRRWPEMAEMSVRRPPRAGDQDF